MSNFELLDGAASMSVPIVQLCAACHIPPLPRRAFFAEPGPTRPRRCPAFPSQSLTGCCGTYSHVSLDETTGTLMLALTPTKKKKKKKK